jgi:hypothetical protein
MMQSCLHACCGHGGRQDPARCAGWQLQAGKHMGMLRTGSARRGGCVPNGRGNVHDTVSVESTQAVHGLVPVLKAAMAYSHLTTALSCCRCDRTDTSFGPKTAASTCMQRHA